MLGVTFLIGGILSALFFKKIKHKGIRSMGKVLFYKNDDEAKVPIIEFTTANGETIKRKPSGFVYSNMRRFKKYNTEINEGVQVIYNPDNPKKFIIENEEGILYKAMEIIICVGLLLIGFSTYVLLRHIHGHYF